MLTTTTNIVTYSTNGSTTVFAVPFSFWDASDLIVVILNNSTGAETTLTITTNYTVSGGKGATGLITTVATYASGYKLQIKRIIPVKQELDLSDNDSFPAESVEQQLDKVVAQVQQINTGQSFNLKGSSFTTGFDFTLPVTLTADRGIKVNAAGTGFDLTDADPDSAADSAAAALASASTAAASASTATTQAGIAAAAAASVPTMATILASVMPVGFVVTLGVSTNPSTLYGFGTWSAIAGRVIVGINAGDTEFDTLNETGGVKSVTLSVNEMPSHDHRLASVTTYSDHCAGCGDATNGVGGPRSDAGQAVSFYSTDLREHDLMENTGGGQAHSNLQPYIVKYVWERTA